MTPTTLERPEQKSGERRPDMMMRRYSWAGSPAMQRLSGEMDRLFEDFGLGRGWLTPFWRPAAADQMWTPAIEVMEKDGRLTVRADLPGLKREDVQVQLTDAGLTIEGERKHESEDHRDGYYRSERSYGSFYRLVPLPDGVETGKARASFKNGVLEISMPVSSQKQPEVRRIDIEA